VEKADMNLIRSQNKRLTMEIALSKMAYMNRLAEKKKSAEPIKTARPSTKVAAETPETSYKKATSSANLKAQPDRQVSKTKASSKDTKDKSSRKYVSLTPSISADIDALVANIEKEETTKRNLSNPFTTEYFQEVFSEWRGKSKFNSFKSAIDHSLVILEENKVIIKTPTEIFMELLKQESKMILDIRSRYPNKELEIEFITDLSAFADYKPPEKTKILTTSEKIQVFKKENKDFEAFVKKLNLKPTN